MNKYWIDGRFTSEGFDQAGWVAGEGLFETIRCEGARIFALNRHMRRAMRAGRELGIAIPKESAVLDALDEVLLPSPMELARLRLLFSKESFAISYESYQEPQGRIRIARSESTANSIAHKTYPYSHRLDLLHAAQAKGFDEVLLTNSKGLVTEGAVSTLFFRDQQGWFTTPLSSGVLPGVMRGLYLDHLEIEVRTLAIEEISSLESVLAVSSLRLAQEATDLGEFQLRCDADSAAMVEKMRQIAHDSSVVLAHG